VEIGYNIAGPAEGLLAWGEGSGPGRMLEPDIILQHVGRHLTGETELSGLRMVVTAGPTREDVDPVRFLGNRSSGRMGYAIAEAGWRLGADVVLITGPTNLDPPVGARVVKADSAQAMYEAVRAELPGASILIMAAAVADFRPSGVVAEKIKKEEQALERIELEATPDILRSTAGDRRPGTIVVGFALETESPLENGRRKLAGKRLDLLVVNDAKEPGAGFEVETNRVTILDREGGVEDLPLLPKTAVADHLLGRVRDLLRSAS
jgi:phosphopantothenoylcysteine decarboxylase/phosphopantothenate--cysteine ligase